MMPAIQISGAFCPLNRAIALLFVTSTLLTGCNEKSEIKVYRVVRPQGDVAGSSEISGISDTPAPENAPSGPMAPIAATETTGAVPSSWEPQPLAQMRQASYLVKGENGAVADISLVRLGGDAGGPLENVNRWLSQLGQPPIDEAKLGQIAQRLNTAMGEVMVVDLSGLPSGADKARDGRIIAALLETTGSTLFFKMRGNSELVESQKDDFVKWVASVCNAGTQSESPVAAAPPGPPSASAQIKWKAPDGWKEGAASAMRYASFSAVGPNNETADISVVTVPGEGGSDADNVNRWRGQIGLPPLQSGAVAAAVTSLKGSNGTFSTIDMTNADKRMLAAWTRHGGQSWFFKITGPRGVVEQEKPRFVEFVRSVEFQP
jgi:hypothetical protein